MTHLSRRSLILGSAAVASAALLPATAASATSSPLHLLRPTGPYAVGATARYVRDTSRSDPWVPSVPARELMITIWYPTRDRRGGRWAYMSAEESRLFIEGKQNFDLPLDILSTVRTFAYAEAKPMGRPRSLPLVVLSPGYTQPRNSLSALAEDLASHGYVVVAIDHTYETYAVTFPDGRVAGCDTCAFDDDRTFFARLYEVRAADVSFVLDQLLGAQPVWSGGHLIDPSRIGMSGHSAGGASAIPAILGDRRIRAGVNMDGSSTGYTPPAPVTRPFLLLGTQSFHSPNGPDASWQLDWDLMTGWKRWITVAGTEHASFNDLALFGEQLGIDFGATTTGTRSTQITRRLNRAMFDRHLRHRAEPLLDRADPRYPEITVAATGG
ncbi:dienelactone hydrolase [Hamadaea flava]|uniref:Alpha/beta hydrolase family protein n=1 Tax=Hamadaea flava TaxID=1742688 RepID=A0ABV8LVU9_9ACTN|nr:hydrolase [Hamadaea flava]MCP2327780.1 dienelactone hydrolase [Hamadaea flava]